MKPKSAFTLIEVLIVVLILGILASLVIPAFDSYIKKAKASEVYPAIRAIETALILYKLEHGTYVEITGGSIAEIKQKFIDILDIDVVDLNSVFFYSVGYIPGSQLKIVAWDTVEGWQLQKRWLFNIGEDEDITSSSAVWYAAAGSKWEDYWVVPLG